MKCPNVESVVEAFSGDVVDTIPHQTQYDVCPTFTQVAAGKCAAYGQ